MPRQSFPVQLTTFSVDDDITRNDGRYLGTYNSMTTYRLKGLKGQVGYLEKATKQSEAS